jgi:hypothetical protein
MPVMLISWKLCFLNLGARVTLCIAVPLYPPSPLQERRRFRYPLLKLFCRWWEKLRMRKETAAAHHVQLVTDWLLVTIPCLYSVTYQLVVNDSVYIQPVSLPTRNYSIYIQPITYWLLLTIPFIHSLSTYWLVTIPFMYSLLIYWLLVTISFHTYIVRVVISSSPYLVHTGDLPGKHINFPFKFIWCVVRRRNKISLAICQQLLTSSKWELNLCDIYLLHLGFHPVAVVGKVVQN